MTERRISKLVFTLSPDDALLATVRTALPDADVRVAKDESLPSEIVDADVTVGGALSDDALAAANRLAWNHVPFAGVERIITPALREKGIVLTNSSGVSAPNMAEHLIAMMLAFGRALPTILEAQRVHRWRGGEHRPAFFELTGQTVILLGTGAIGTETAKRLRPFGPRLIGANRHGTSSNAGYFDHVISFEQLPSVLPQADHIVSSLPFTPGTERILSRSMLESAKHGANVFNVGRGKTVDQDALIELLHSGQIAGAGLDVTDPEPLPSDHPLWDAPNVIITGHTSGGSPRVKERVADLLTENIRRFQAGEDLLNVVDLDEGY